MAEDDQEKEPMKVMTMRVPVSLTDRIEELAVRLQDLALGFDVSRSEVSRRALERGLEALESEIAAQEGRRQDPD